MYELILTWGELFFYGRSPSKETYQKMPLLKIFFSPLNEVIFNSF